MRLMEDKSWIEQGTTETEHEIADHLQKAADAIEELTDKNVGKWISVTERLPEWYEDVQILFPNNQAVGFYNKCDGWCIYTGDGWFSIVGKDEVQPTHWAKKLPNPQEEEQK